MRNYNHMLTVRITKEQKERLKALAKSQKRKLADCVRLQLEKIANNYKA